MNYYNISIEEALNKADSSEQGLSALEANERLKKVGLNEITVKSTPLWKKLLSPFLDAFMLVLIFAAAISLLHGDNLDVIIIIAIVAINAIISYIQDFSTERILRELKKTSEQIVEVIRDGTLIKINKKYLAPGDIIQLSEGDKIPADGRIISANSVRVNESLLTGESLPISKTSDTLEGGELPAYAQTNMLFQGAFIISGNLNMLVTATGSQTEFGKLAELSTNITSESPVQVKINRLVFQIIIATIVLAVIAFGLSMWRGMDIFESLKFVMALSVSVVPEGLPIAISIILALGMRRMAQRKALVRNLRAIETVGVITTIATDKTGTLTENRLTLQKIYTLLTETDFIRIIAKAKNSSDKTHDPLDTALDEYIKLSGKAFNDIDPVVSFGFNQDLALSGNLWRNGEGYRLSAKGAPEILIAKSSLSEEDKIKIENKLKEFAGQGLRVIAVVEAILKERIETLDDFPSDTKFEFCGLIAVADILRPESADAIRKAQQAGVSVRMITGDHPETAFHIGHELGLAQDKNQIFDASQIKNLSDEDLEKAVRNARVFARITPESKFKILKILEKTEITAMTGDGVNDVPALSAANVGFAMGSGSEIAKDAGDIILLDDNFKSIITAMREGRVIVANIRRMLFYALGTNAGEALTMIGSLLIGIPLPLVPVQILWINLVTDTALIIPLGLEPGADEIMAKKPNHPNQPILGKTIIIRMILVAVLMAVTSITIFIFYSAKLGEDIARTLTFTALTTMQWGNAINARSNTSSIIHRLKVYNGKFVIGMVLAIALQALALFSPLSEFLHVSAAPLQDLATVTIISFILPIIVVEIHKFTTKTRSTTD